MAYTYSYGEDASNYELLAYNGHAPDSIHLDPTDQTERLPVANFYADQHSTTSRQTLLSPPSLLSYHDTSGAVGSGSDLRDDGETTKRDIGRKDRTSISYNRNLDVSLERSWNLGAWTEEIVACIVSICAMLGLIALLRYYNNRPLSSWTLHTLSFNAMIAILSTIIRVSSMLPVGMSLYQSGWVHARRPGRGKKTVHRLDDIEVFQNAARGPLGSLKMLFKLKPAMSSLGALLTISALGFDVFSQQVLSLPGKPIITGGAPGITSVQVLNALDSVAWTGALYNGIFSTTSIPSLVTPCSTGNCKWPKTPTMAVCGGCVDLTDQLEVSCSGENGWCNYTTPLGVEYSCVQGEASYAVIGGGITLTAPMPGKPIGNWTYSGDVPSVLVTNMGIGGARVFPNNATASTAIAIFDLIDVKWGPDPDPPLGTSNMWLFQPATAVQCGVWPCLQLLDTQTLNGITKETIVETTSLISFRSLGGGFSSNDNVTFVNVSQDFNTGERLFTYDGTATQGFFCGYKSNDGTSSLFTADASVDLMYPETYNGETKIIQTIHDRLNATDGELDLWIQQLAKSLTNEMRSSAAPANLISNNTDFLGIEYGTEPFIVIRWGWLALPIAMVILSSVFLAFSIVETDRARAPAWKASPLGMLFCKVDHDLDYVAGNSLDSAKKIAEKVGKRPMILSREDDGKWVVTTRC